MLLNGTPEQKKKLIREYLTGESESSSGDEFEKEMEAELCTTIKTIEGTWGPSTAGKSELNVCVPLRHRYGGFPDVCGFIFQQKPQGAEVELRVVEEEEEEAFLHFLTPGCTMKFTLTLTQRRRTRQVSMNVFTVT